MVKYHVVVTATTEKTNMQDYDTKAHQEDYGTKARQEDHFLLAVFEGWCMQRNTEIEVLRQEQKYIEEQHETRAWLDAMLND